jgi:hypothetical protein
LRGGMAVGEALAAWGDGPGRGVGRAHAALEVV